MGTGLYMIGIGKTSNFTWDGTETDITVIGKKTSTKNQIDEKKSFSFVQLLHFTRAYLRTLVGTSSTLSLKR